MQPGREIAEDVGGPQHQREIGEKRIGVIDGGTCQAHPQRAERDRHEHVELVADHRHCRAGRDQRHIRRDQRQGQEPRVGFHHDHGHQDSAAGGKDRGELALLRYLYHPAAISDAAYPMPRAEPRSLLMTL